MNYIRALALGLFTFSYLAIPDCFASVVITGTRIIYSESIKEKTVQLTNNDNYPNIMHVWMDTDSGHLATKNSEIPFIITPPIFRMEPKSGQQLRLHFTGDSLPKDRESMFYLNVSQTPSLDEKHYTMNKLVFIFNTRIKVFFRPRNLVGNLNKLANELIFIPSQNKISIQNPTGYYAVIRFIELLSKSKPVKIANSLLIAPKSSVDCALPMPIDNKAEQRLELTLVNDHGADVTSQRILSVNQLD